VASSPSRDQGRSSDDPCRHRRRRDHDRALKVRAWRAAYATFMPADVLAALDPAGEAEDWADHPAAMPAAYWLWVADDGEVTELAGWPAASRAA